jgi:hypothetical protein
MPAIDTLLGAVVTSDNATIFLVAWILYQVYCPKRFHPYGGTKIQKIVDEVEKEIADTRELVKAAITVIRGLARTDESIDTEAVDEYLVENGTKPSTFVKDTEDGGSGHAPINPSD